MSIESSCYFSLIEQALLSADIEEKRRLVAELACEAPLGLESESEAVVEGNLEPGRPELPELVHPAAVSKRRLNSKRGRLALIHAVAHIEFNAINLALDAAWRFRGMPAAYYTDWIKVANDESRHFGWLNNRLQQEGCAYGDFQAHNGLWEAAIKTAHDPLIRMALVPRVLEARGLDVTPGMIKRLELTGDADTVDILKKILEEEIIHVETGSRWYHYLCDQRQINAAEEFPELLQKYMQSLPRGPFNFSARSQAGFSDAELEWLGSLDVAKAGASA